MEPRNFNVEGVGTNIYNRDFKDLQIKCSCDLADSSAIFRIPVIKSYKKLILHFKKSIKINEIIHFTSCTIICDGSLIFSVLQSYLATFYLLLQTRKLEMRFLVLHPEIKEPIAVRYAWADFPLCNLYNKEGLPAIPCSTDDF
jgi:hypothetical protein